MKSKLTSNVTNRGVLWAAAIVLVTLGVAQSRTFAIDGSERDTTLLAAANTEAKRGLNRAPADRYGTTRSPKAFGFGRVQNLYVASGQQLIDDIVCEGRVTDGGWGISEPVAFYVPPIPSARVNFGGSASMDRQGRSAGQQQYADRNAVDAFDFHSTIVTDVTCQDLPLAGKRAIIMGQGRVTKLASPFVDMIENFVIKLDDIADPGRGQDMYQIQLNGTFLYDSGPVVLEGGNVQVR